MDLSGLDQTKELQISLGLPLGFVIVAAAVAIAWIRRPAGDARRPGRDLTRKDEDDKPT